MKKYLNGRMVEITDLQLRVIEQSLADAKVKRQSDNKILNLTGVDMRVITRYIGLYSSFYKSLPYPLYNLDNNAKYNAIGKYIKAKLNDEITSWVDNALFIVIDSKNELALKFVNDTWGIIRVNEVPDSNFDSDSFMSLCGYTEFEWILERMLEGKSTTDFYHSFIPSITTACNDSASLLKHEIDTMFNLHEVPTQMKFIDNKLIDIENNCEYILDIFATGTRKSGRTEKIWKLTSSEGFDETQEVYETEYGMEVYKKNYGKDNVPSKIVKTRLYGAISVFNTLLAIQSVLGNNVIQIYRGAISNGYIIYEVCHRIFVAKAFRYTEPIEIARESELYACGMGMVYFKKQEVAKNGAIKESIYSCSLKDYSITLCKMSIK